MPLRDLFVGDVGRLQARVLIIAVERAVELVAAGLDHHLRLHAGLAHVGAVAGGAGGHFFECAVVDIHADGAGAFGGDEAIDHHAILIAARVIGAIAALRAGGAAADVDARHRHAGRLRQDGPHVARARNRRQLFGSRSWSTSWSTTRRPPASRRSPSPFPAVRRPPS